MGKQRLENVRLFNVSLSVDDMLLSTFDTSEMTIT